MNMQPNDQNQVDESDKYQIRISDLPGEIREIALLIGLKSTLKLVTEYGGESVYLPKYDAVTKAVRNRAILEEFNGSNIKELAMKFNLTARYIRTIINEAK